MTNPDIKEVLFTESVIRLKVKELAHQIDKDYSGKTPVIIAILKGSIVFLCDLIRELKIPHVIDFMSLSSYEGATESTGVVRLNMDLHESIVNKDVLIVEDIVDTGLTLSYLKENLLTRGPESLKICVLLDKKVCRKKKVKVDYTGFEMPDKFCVGYGLDYKQLYRNLPFIGVLKPDVYRRKK